MRVGKIHKEELLQPIVTLIKTKTRNGGHEAHMLEMTNAYKTLPINLKRRDDQ
jgi:hypothetical protein